jgi:hypothetical protein
MKKLSRSARKCIIIVHILLAMLWFGSRVAGNYILMTGLPQTSTASLLASLGVLEQLGDISCIATNGIVLSSLLLSLLTEWGFVKFRWVMVSWLLTVALGLLGAMGLGTWAENLTHVVEVHGLSARESPEYLRNHTLLVVFGNVQALGMVFVIWAHEFKPWGRRKPRSAAAEATRAAAAEGAASICDVHTGKGPLLKST